MNLISVEPLKDPGTDPNADLEGNFRQFWLLLHVEAAWVMAIILVINDYEKLGGHKNEAKMAKLELDRTLGGLGSSLKYFRSFHQAYSHSPRHLAATRGNLKIVKKT